MLRTQISGHIALLMQRIDSLKDLVEDTKCFFLGYGLSLDVTLEIGGIWLRDQPQKLAIRNLLLYFEKMVGKGHRLSFAKDGTIEL